MILSTLSSVLSTSTWNHDLQLFMIKESLLSWDKVQNSFWTLKLNVWQQWVIEILTLVNCVTGLCDQFFWHFNWQHSVTSEKVKESVTDISKVYCYSFWHKHRLSVRLFFWVFVILTNILNDYSTFKNIMLLKILLKWGILV